ncbi:MAG: hypothetical protein IPN90_10595 [Elusimicrobia bacterium]|nr:hypothetical protein [Elusimicrobiota bacterium]
MKRRGVWVLLWAFVFMQGSLWAVDPGALMDQGKRQYEKGEYGKALQTFLKVKKEDPANSLVREYISKCTEKIMEAEKGAREKEFVLSGKSSSAIILPKEPAPAWAVPKPKPPRKDPKGAFGYQRKVHRSAAPVVPDSVRAKGKKPSQLLVQQGILAKGYENKILDGQALELVRKGGRVEIVAFMNRLFLPFSDTLAPDAVVALDLIAQQLQADPGKSTLLRAMDSLTPAVRRQMLDLPTRRVSILFSYLMHASLGKGVGKGRGTYTAADLDD